MREQLSSDLQLSTTISSLIHSINKVRDNLASMLSLWFEQVAEFSKRVMSNLVDTSQYILTDRILQSLRTLKLHLTDIVKELETDVHSLNKHDVLNMLHKKESQLISHLQSNTFFDRSYGWYVKQDIMWTIKKAVESLNSTK